MERARLEMVEQRKHIEGFTLAELLLSIAIVLVLAALAIPSIVSAQNNMRMLQLNSAAESIANAAQVQMTALKVSGTWLALIEDDATGGPSYPLATNPPGNAPADTYYLTADEARSNGIVPSLSVDDEVRDGDYVIEFTASTAQVVSVFYTDGKPGFLSDPQRTDAVSGPGGFYENHSDMRDDVDGVGQSFRADYRPMMGYYEGAPTGATDVVALKNPVVSVDDLGRLCVRDPNLTDSQGLATYVQVTVTLESAPGGPLSFVVGGLDGSASAYSVQAGTASRPYFNKDANKVYELVESEPLSGADTYVIDLNDLVASMGADSSEEARSILATIDEIAASGADLRVDVQVTSEEPGIPASASAYVVWPKKVATLTVLVTNPALDAHENKGESSTAHITGAYTEPVVKTVTTSGDDPVTGIAMSPTYETFDVPTPNLLKAENVEAGRQSYSGGWVKLAEAHEQKANVQVTTGAYTPNGTSIDTRAFKNPVTGATVWPNGGLYTSSTTPHQYQIYEIWINGVRTGYLHQGEWVWEGDFGRLFSKCVSEIDSDTVQFTIDVEQLYGSIEQTADGFTLYVRTTPLASEVKEYFDAHAADIAKNMGGGATSGSRGQNLGAPIRQPFENEFGSSSTVSLWNITTSGGTNLTKRQYPAMSDLRIYYSASPAVAWGSSAVYRELPSAQLWVYERDDAYDNDKPVAYVRASRTNANYALISSDSADYELSTTRDYLFYRVLQYCDENGEPLEGVDPQYVPYTAMLDSKVATIQDVPEERATKDDGSAFDRWETTDVYPEGGAALSCEAGRLVGSYDAQLSFGAVRLKAVYQNAAVGAMYLELDAAGEVTGYVGVSDSGEGRTERVESLPTDNAIDSTGYYYVVPQGSDAPEYQLGGDASSEHNWQKLDKTSISFAYNGVACDVYRLPSGAWSQSGNETVHFPVRSAGRTTTYWYNTHFAGAITANEAEAAAWGKDAETPWIVRHALQFPGQLDDHNVEPKYMQDFFAQTHDLDFANVGGNAGKNFQQAFLGSYDGNGFSLHNAYLGTSSSGGSGLFPVAGLDYQGAQIRNIVVQSTSTTLPPPGYGSAGILVGVANNCVIDNVTIESTLAKSSVSAASLGFVIGTANQSEIGNVHLSGTLPSKATATTFGGFVGSATGSAIMNCSIQNIDLGLSGGSASSAGGFVGKMDGGQLSGCSAGNIKLSAGKGSQHARIGGFVGSMYKAQVSDCTAGTMKVSAEGGNLVIGGFAGLVSGGEWGYLANCYAEEAKVEAEGSNPGPTAGGFVGSMVDDATVTQSWVEGKASVSVEANGGGSVVGGFVGQLVSGRIEGASVAAESEIELKQSASWVVDYLGGFAGSVGSKDQATTAAIVNASVRDIEVEYEPPSNTTASLGGLVGLMEPTGSLDACSVDNVELSAERADSSSAQTANIGGLVGEVHAPSEGRVVKTCAVQKVELKSDLPHAKAGGFFGAISGASATAPIAASADGNSGSNIVIESNGSAGRAVGFVSDQRQNVVEPLYADLCSNVVDKNDKEIRDAVGEGVKW